MPLSRLALRPGCPPRITGSRLRIKRRAGNPALELRTGWGGSVRRRAVIPSIPQVLRLAQTLDLVKPGLGDVAMALAFTGLRWEEAVAVPIGNVSLDGQCMKMDRTASESGGRRDVREETEPARPSARP